LGIRGQAPRDSHFHLRFGTRVPTVRRPHHEKFISFDMQQQKKALGKGLGALIHSPFRKPDTTTAVIDSSVPAPGERVRRVPLQSVVPSPMQPRKGVREDQLAELVDSIREHGVIQPLIVREIGSKFEVIAGERRWRACGKLEMTEIPVIVRTATDREVLEMALIENLQREDLNPIEEAEAYSRLAHEFQLKQEEIAQRVGKNRATVANAMRLLELAPGVKSLLISGQLSVGHAKVLLALKDPALQFAVAEQVVRRHLTVRATEKFVADASKNGALPVHSPAARKSAGAAQPSEVTELEQRLRERFSTKVAIHYGGKKGRIELEYYGNDDLDRILGLMGLPARCDVL
jgi:ParB family chromosome partitioning protein